MAWPITKRWVALGGMVKSRKTGEVVYAEARLLAKAYGIDPRDVVCIDTRDFTERQLKASEWRIRVAYEGLPVLRPRDEGDYEAVGKQLRQKFGYRGRKR